MKQTVLIPTDFSENALRAAIYALDLAEHMKLEVHILHAYQPFKSAFQSASTNEDDADRARKEAESGMEEFIKKLGDRQALEARVVNKSLVDAIADCAANQQVGLVVMGTHGKSPVRRDLLGSNTYEVAKSTAIPLLVVPEQVGSFALKQVVFFSDYQAGDVQTLRSLETVFGDLPFSVNLVHILPGKYTSMQEEQSRLDQWKTTLEKQVPSGGLVANLVEGEESVSVVEETLARFQADIALLTIVNRSFFQNLFTKSLARAIVLNPQVPILLTSEAMK